LVLHLCLDVCDSYSNFIWREPFDSFVCIKTARHEIKAKESPDCLFGLLRYIDFVVDFRIGKQILSSLLSISIIWAVIEFVVSASNPYEPDPQSWHQTPITIFAKAGNNEKIYSFPIYYLSVLYSALKK